MLRKAIPLLVLLLTAPVAQAGFWSDAKAEARADKEQVKKDAGNFKQDAKESWSGFKKGLKKTGEGFKDVGRAIKKDTKKSVDKAKKDFSD